MPSGLSPKDRLTLTRIPFLPLARVSSKIFTGMSFNQVSPIKDIKNVFVPVLFIHGANDTFIQPDMA